MIEKPLEQKIVLINIKYFHPQVVEYMKKNGISPRVADIPDEL